MSEISVFFVPESDDAFTGREVEVAESFWKLGIFLETDDEFILKRLDQYRSAGKQIPESTHSFTHSGMGIGSPGEPVPVPYRLWELACPSCGTDVLDLAYEAWGSDSDLPLSRRQVICPTCRFSSATEDLKSQDGFTFASFYLWVSNIDEENWEPSFKTTVESILGPCREYRVCDT